MVRGFDEVNRFSCLGGLIGWLEWVCGSDELGGGSGDCLMGGVLFGI